MSKFKEEVAQSNRKEVASLAIENFRKQQQLRKTKQAEESINAPSYFQEFLFYSLAALGIAAVVVVLLIAVGLFGPRM
jgi:hypothetical protein